MSEPKEPSPFEKLRLLAKQVVNVPKAEIQRREEEWKEARKNADKPKKVGR